MDRLDVKKNERVSNINPKSYPISYPKEHPQEYQHNIPNKIPNNTLTIIPYNFSNNIPFVCICAPPSIPLFLNRNGVVVGHIVRSVL